jgi:large subunit ribosomal protein L6
MSRLAKKPIMIPQGVTVTLAPTSVKVKGPHGELDLNVRPDVKIEQAEGTLSVSAAKINKKTKALPGTYVAHIKNMLHGVTKKFEKKLLLEGVGYKSEVKGKNLVLALGFSHPVEVAIPEGLAVTAEKNVISIQGISKELLGQFAAKVRALKEPEPYKGKGFRYDNEVIRRKQGKKSV